MKVCYLITTLGHGRGGHFYDLRTTAEALSRRLECVILNVGVCASPVIDSASVRSHNVWCNGFDVLRQSSRILAREGADVIHAFDARVVFLAGALSAMHRKPLVLTKCGGPNPKWYYPPVGGGRGASGADACLLPTGRCHGMDPGRGLSRRVQAAHGRRLQQRSPGLLERAERRAACLPAGGYDRSPAGLSRW